MKERKDSLNDPSIIYLKKELKMLRKYLVMPILFIVMLISFIGVGYPIQTVNIYRPKKLKKFTTIIGQNSALFVPQNDRGNFTNPQLMKVMDEEGLGMIRFPGGTFANFFNWDTMTMDEGFINIVKKRNMLNLVKKQKKVNHGKLWKAKFDTYIQATLIRNMQRTIVLPVYQRDADYNIQLIKKIKSKYNLKMYWELGNELQFYEYRFKFNKDYPWNEQIYARRFMKIAKFIRQNYPEDKIGILLVKGNIGENQLTPVPDKIIKMVKPWNKELEKEKYLPYYDGIIQHPYIVPKSTPQWEKFLRLNKNKSETVDIDNLKLGHIFALVQNIPENEVHDFEKFIVKGKKIYITESGLLSHSKNNIKNLNQSIVDVVFNIAYFISWMRYPNDVGIYMRHILGNGNGIQSVYKDYSWNAVTISWNILKLARQNVQEIAPVIINNSPVYYGIGKTANKTANIQIKALTALYLKGDKEKILIANTSTRRVELKLPFEKSKIIYAYDKEKKHIAVGTVHKLTDYAKIKEISSREWIMPAFSVALIISE